MTSPLIRIAYNRFLDPIFIGWIQAQEQFKDWLPPSKDEVFQRISNYQTEWEMQGPTIVSAIQEITGLEFKQNEIRVHIVSGNPRPFSNPIVLKSRYTKTEFITVLAHELIHVLFQDNHDRVGSKDRVEHENPIVAAHVVVHAILKHIYLDIIKTPKYLKTELEMCSGSDLGYKEAWKIVEAGNYRQIIKDFKARI